MELFSVFLFELFMVVYRNATDFCPVQLMSCHFVDFTTHGFECFLSVESFDFSTPLQMMSNRDTDFFLPNLGAFILLYPLLTLLCEICEMLNAMVKADISAALCPVPDLRGNVFNT